jgi:hypothetical protein
MLPVDLQVTQYAACSENALAFVPAENVSDGVVGGAVSVHLSNNIIGENRTTVESLVDNYITDNNHNWLTDFDHLMYVFPAGVDFFGALAYAYIAATGKSVYNDVTASYVTTTMHEIGHNLGMAHSGEGTNPYSDNSCYMGKLLFCIALCSIE